jgi:hypothetical protein
MKINDLVSLKDKDKIILGYVEQIYTERFGFVKEYIIKSILELEGYDKVTYNPRQTYHNYIYSSPNVFKYDFIKTTGDKQRLNNNLAMLISDYPDLKLELEALSNE